MRGLILVMSLLSGMANGKSSLTPCINGLSKTFSAVIPVEAVLKSSVRSDVEFVGLLLVLYGIESRYNVDAISSAGAIGIGQLMPATAREAAAELGDPIPHVSDLFSVTVNIRLSSYHLNKLLTRYDGNTALALTAYNAGGKWAAKLAKLKRIPRETSDYLAKVLYLTEKFCRGEKI